MIRAAHAWQAVREAYERFGGSKATGEESFSKLMERRHFGYFSNYFNKLTRFLFFEPFTGVNTFLSSVNNCLELCRADFISWNVKKHFYA